MRNKFFHFPNFGRKSWSHCLTSCALITILTGCACTDNRKPDASSKKENTNHNEVADAGVIGTKPFIAKATARIHPLQDNKVLGQVTFIKVPGGIQIVADVEGLPEGEHGFHIHEFGSCEGEGESAGSHFNPTHSQHGGPNNHERHAGDLGNITADANGHAHYEWVNSMISFEGENSILGRSIIIHSDPDDYTTQPAGNSGKKIGCGVIEAVKTQL